jgi:serine/threonine-protein kinase
MLVGEVPFQGETTSATMAMHLTHRVDDPRTHRPGLSKTTSRIVLTMTAKDPRDRYSDPASVITDLRLLSSELMLRDSPSSASSALRVPPAPKSAGRGSRRRRRR